MTDDIVDRIDQLVDDQVVGGERLVRDSFGDSAQYPRCSHCGRHWHGLPITERVAQMYTLSEFDEEYRVDTDDSHVLCRGSDFIGPMPAESAPWAITLNSASPQFPEWLDELIDDTSSFVAEQIDFIAGTSVMNADVIREMIERPNIDRPATDHHDFGCAPSEPDDGGSRSNAASEPWQVFHDALRHGTERIRESLSRTAISIDDAPMCTETAVAMVAEERARRTIDSIMGLVQTINNLVQDYSNR